MPYVTALAYSDKTGNNQTNELVGQIKDFLLNNSSLVTLVSDNNPAPGSSTARIVNLQVGNSGHYLRIRNYSSSLEFDLRNLANNDYLSNYGDSAPNNKTMHLVHGPNMLALRYGDRVAAVFFKDTSGNMWGRAGTSYKFYPYDSDTEYSFAPGSPYRRNANGQAALLPGRVGNAEIYSNYLYAFNNQDVWPVASILQDEAGTYYMIVYTATSSVGIGPYSIYPALLAQEG